MASVKIVATENRLDEIQSILESQPRKCWDCIQCDVICNWQIAWEDNSIENYIDESRLFWVDDENIVAVVTLINEFCKKNSDEVISFEVEYVRRSIELD